MKKTYERPIMRVIMLCHQSHILQMSPAKNIQGKFDDDPDYDEWDSNGAQ